MEATAGEKLPRLEAALRTIAMPADANPRSDIFGGWLLTQMDLASTKPGRGRFNVELTGR